MKENQVLNDFKTESCMIASPGRRNLCWMLAPGDSGTQAPKGSVGIWGLRGSVLTLTVVISYLHFVHPAAIYRIHNLLLMFINSD